MQAIFNQVKQYWAMTLIALFILYFLLAALQGNSGLFRLFQLNAQIEAASLERDDLYAQRVKLENLTKRLSDNYLDLDLLDEQARKRLGLIRKDEIIIR